MKKVLFLIDSLNDGGAEKILLDIIDNLNADKYCVDLKTVWKRGYYTDKLPSSINYSSIINELDDSLFSRIINCFFEGVLHFFNGRLLHFFFIRDKYDVEIAFLEGASTKLVSGARCKKIAWVHVNMERNRWYEQFYHSAKQLKNTYNSFDKICCVSEELKKIFDSRIYQSEKSVVVHNPIDAQEICALSNEESCIKLTGDGIKIITVGRLEHEKGFDRLINIASSLTEKGYRFSIFILGEGSQREQLKEQCIRMGVDGVIHFLGFASNPYSVVKQADLFVCSSRTEGFSTAVTEAIILGIPVVTTNCAGMDELLQSGRFGLITDNEEMALESSIKSIFDNSDVLRVLRDKAAIGAEYYASVDTIKQVEAIIDE